MIANLLLKAATPKVVGVAFIALALTGAFAGVQTLRLAWCQGDLRETKVTLNTVRGDRDEAVRTANENAAATAAVKERLDQCVASKAADVAKARLEAEAAIRERETINRELQRELSALRSVYESDAESGAWADTVVPAGVADSLRRDP